MLSLTANKIAQRAEVLKIACHGYNDAKIGTDSAFADLKETKPVEVFHLRNLYLEDKYEKKVNLGIGAYRTENSEPFVLPIVRQCLLEVVQNPYLNHEYLPIMGNTVFSQVATEFVLGKDCKAIKEKRTVSAHTIAGTSALRLGSELLCHHLKKRLCFLPDPTYGNHVNILRTAGFKQFKTYPYWNVKNKKINIAKLLAALCQAPEGAVIMLQASGHNPTGLDPSKKQWKQIAEVMKMRNLFPFFDAAYIGMSSGNPDRDAWAIRHFVKHGHETLIALSFSKNMGLYNERIGNLIAVVSDQKYAAAVFSEITNLIRVAYSNPPTIGSKVIVKVLGNKHNRATWLNTIDKMSERVRKMREQLVKKLNDLGTPGTWDHITQGKGMFAYLGLNPEQCKKLTVEKHIYLLSSSRINVCGLNYKNLDYVAECIHEIVCETAGTGPEKEEETKGKT
ncbi:aspartate aminotransferase, cytoplasmic-like [Drosophila hydei]|uniref:Aspartate aminotransferase n=1 Tax=Drosophila hydei TaxID=7224 RepID=A0A6J1MEN2_DROHY|nr:aspartate aminotransferase, cytoplasmic-like [Drosophila hydei]